jgi:3-hydroxymyristoyl/3-hydroxydecanoyl-(acyl carrier protein) dehydratase
VNHMHNSLADIFQGDEWPDLLDIDQSGDKSVFRFKIGADLKWLKGHFPEQPVLPGVVQTHWACCLAQQVFSLPQNIKRIDNLKFQNVILPHQEVSLELARHSSGDSVTFRYSDPATPAQAFSEGKLVF